MQSWRAWSVLVLLMVGCTSPNPRSCADGACTDPSLPFCDLDGAIAGTEATCIAVTCAANEHAACRGDVAIRCNAEGTNYDLVQCELGCSDAVGGCSSCTMDSQCSNPMPVCEASTETCRACAKDDECESDVCDLDSGRCLAVSEVLYVSLTGQHSAPCSQLAPCSLTQGVSLAKTNALRSTVLLAPGTYSQFIGVAAGSVTLIGRPGVVLDGVPSLGTIHVGRGGTLKVRGARIELTKNGLACGGVGNTGDPYKLGGTVELLDVEMVASSQVWNMFGCTARIRRTSLTSTAIATVISSDVDSTLEADRFLVRSPEATPVSIIIPPVTRMTNSLLDNAYFSSTGSGQQIITFTTVFANHAYGAFLGASPGMIIENNVLVSASGVAIDCAACPNLKNNIVHPQAVVAPGTNNVTADPQFVDAIARNFQLKATSPALNKAVSSPGLSTDHDYEGLARPQGAAPDIGAFERTP